MSKIKVCYFNKWDGNKNVRSPRRAKVELIESMGCEPIEDSCIEVDETEIDGNGFYPNKEAI